MIILIAKLLIKIISFISYIGLIEKSIHMLIIYALNGLEDHNNLVM